jgi:hypothetical protein
MKKITRRPVFPLDYGVPESLDGTLPWQHVTEKLKKALHYWVSTVDSNQRPHATPVWGAWVDETLYFDGSPQTKRGRNLKSNPNIAIHLESGTDVLIIHGKAIEIIPIKDLAIKLSEEYNRKYQSETYTASPDFWLQGGLYRVDFSVIFAWTKFPDDATKWVID